MTRSLPWYNQRKWAIFSPRVHPIARVHPWFRMDPHPVRFGKALGPEVGQPPRHDKAPNHNTCKGHPAGHPPAPTGSVSRAVPVEPEPKAKTDRSGLFRRRRGPTGQSERCGGVV